MIRALARSIVKGKHQDPVLPDDDVELAIGVLLVRVAFADKAYLMQEADQIDLVLATAHDLRPSDATLMRQKCEDLDDHFPSSMELACLLRTRLSQARRQQIVSLMWRVVFADRVEHIEEDRMMAVAQELLGVAEDDCAALRAAELTRAVPMWPEARPV